MHIFDVVDFSDQCLHSLQQRAFKVYLRICNKYQSHLYHMYDVKNKCILLNALWLQGTVIEYVTGLAVNVT